MLGGGLSAPPSFLCTCLQKNISANWTGTLKQLRFDPTGKSGSFSIYIGSATPSPIPAQTLTPTPRPTRTVTPTLTTTVTATQTATPDAHFTYDADGNMVKSVIGGVTTLFVSANYQVDVTHNEVTKYYPGGAFRVDGVLYYSLTDHLGSTGVTTDADGTQVSEIRYNAWGGIRYSSGTNPSDKTYTGQRSYASDFGLIYYNARWYDCSLGRFAQTDTVVPSIGSSQAWDRYAYSMNNPLRYIDPSGHSPESPYNILPWNYDTMGFGFKGVVEAVVGVKVDIVCYWNQKALRNSLETLTQLKDPRPALNGFDVSLNLEIAGTAGAELEGALGLFVSGDDGTVSDQAQVASVLDGELPVNISVAKDVGGGAGVVFDTTKPNGVSGVNYWIGGGYGGELSGDYATASSQLGYTKWNGSGWNGHWNNATTVAQNTINETYNAVLRVWDHTQSLLNP